MATSRNSGNPQDRPAAGTGKVPAAGQHIGKCLHPDCGWHPKPNSGQWEAPAEHVDLTGHTVVSQRVGR